MQQNIDPNKIFIINRSELVGRIDATAYKKVFSFDSKVYPVYKLSDVAIINPNTVFDKFNGDELITFIPMEAIDEFSGSIKKQFFKKINDSKGFTRFKENDLIWAKITPCMQNGKSAIVKNTLNGYACGSTEFFILRPKTNNILIEYIHFFLKDKRVLENAQNYFGGSAGQQRVSKDFLLNFRIPLPPINIQKDIVKKIEFAYIQKQQKESQARALLESIDTYLLNELGITLPKKDNSLQNRIFTSRFSEIAGLRLDPLFFKNKSKIESHIYNNIPLRKIAIISKGQSITKAKISEGNYPVIAGGQSSPYNHSEYNFEGNIITISASGAYSGFVWYHNYPIFASDCIVIKSKDESEVSTQFISYVLKALQQEIYKMQQGAGQPHVYSRDIEKILIPTPLPEKQKEIIKHINNIHNKIKTLNTEATALLENAKQEVEKMIIGK